MKNNSFRFVAGLAALFASSLAWSIPLSTVISADTLVTSADLGNSGSEEDWLSGYLGYDVTFEDKAECDQGECSWQTVDGTDLFAFELTGTPTYFLVKTGNQSSIDNDGNGESDTHFLFLNVGSLDYGVFSLAQLGFTSTNVTITKVSHVSEFGTSVPAPAPLLLLGAGLLGVGFARKKVRA